MFLRFLWVFAQLCERSFGGIAAGKAASEILHFWGQKNETKYNFTTFGQDYNDIMNEFLEKEEQVLKMLKTVFDPEIPVNIYDLGLIYKVDITDDGTCNIDMTLTAPSCPAADFLVEDIEQKVRSVEGINKVVVNIVFEPAWTKDMMSEEAKLELGFL